MYDLPRMQADIAALTFLVENLMEREYARNADPAAAARADLAKHEGILQDAIVAAINGEEGAEQTREPLVTVVTLLQRVASRLP